jgi:hypothetical protein
MLGNADAQVIVHQYDHTLLTESVLYCSLPWLGRVCDAYLFPANGALVAGLGNLLYRRLQHTVHHQNKLEVRKAAPAQPACRP